MHFREVNVLPGTSVFTPDTPEGCYCFLTIFYMMATGQMPEAWSWVRPGFISKRSMPRLPVVMPSRRMPADKFICLVEALTDRISDIRSEVDLEDTLILAEQQCCAFKEFIGTDDEFLSYLEDEIATIRETGSDIPPSNF